jgi:hypothetical protein
VSDQSALEKETFSFYNYLKEIFQDTDCNQIFLADLLPDSTKTVAAQAFYHGKISKTKRISFSFSNKGYSTSFSNWTGNKN